MALTHDSENGLAYQKMSLFRRSGFEEVYFNLNHEFEMKLSRSFVEELDELDVRYHILDLEGLRFIFISPETVGLAGSIRDRIRARLGSGTHENSTSSLPAGKDSGR